MYPSLLSSLLQTTPSLTHTDINNHIHFAHSHITINSQTHSLTYTHSLTFIQPICHTTHKSKNPVIFVHANKLTIADTTQHRIAAPSPFVPPYPKKNPKPSSDHSKCSTSLRQSLPNWLKRSQLVLHFALHQPTPAPSMCD